MLRLVMGKQPTELNKHGAEELSGADWGNWLGTEAQSPAFATVSDFLRLPELTISCIIKKGDTESSEEQTINLHRVKVDTWDFTIDANDVIVENMNFYAEYVVIKTPS